MDGSPPELFLGKSQQLARWADKTPNFLPPVKEFLRSKSRQYLEKAIETAGDPFYGMPAPNLQTLESTALPQETTSLTLRIPPHLDTPHTINALATLESERERIKSGLKSSEAHIRTTALRDALELRASAREGLGTIKLYSLNHESKIVSSLRSVNTDTVNPDLIELRNLVEADANIHLDANQTVVIRPTEHYSHTDQVAAYTLILKTLSGSPTPTGLELTSRYLASKQNQLAASDQAKLKELHLDSTLEHFKQLLTRRPNLDPGVKTTQIGGESQRIFFPWGEKGPAYPERQLMDLIGAMEGNPTAIASVREMNTTLEAVSGSPFPTGENLILKYADWKSGEYKQGADLLSSARGWLATQATSSSPQ